MTMIATPQSATTAPTQKNGMVDGSYVTAGSWLVSAGLSNPAAHEPIPRRNPPSANERWRRARRKSSTPDRRGHDEPVVRLEADERRGGSRDGAAGDVDDRGRLMHTFRCMASVHRSQYQQDEQRGGKGHQQHQSSTSRFVVRVRGVVARLPSSRSIQGAVSLSVATKALEPLVSPPCIRATISRPI